MLSQKLEKAINVHINAEIFSSYLYYSMASYFDSKSLKGFAHWMRIQALEEMTHAHKFIMFLGDRGGRAIMQTVEGPQNEWESPLATVIAVYEHEVKVSGLINGLMDMAIEEKDYASVNFLQWFVGEQVEEEASADEVVQKLGLIEQTKGGLFMLDQEMNKRVFTLPQDLAGVF
ncbi:ferritin [bacterium]|nr:ferritin [bacterium]